eukprot:Rmarinus@m.11094
MDEIEKFLNTLRTNGFDIPLDLARIGLHIANLDKPSEPGSVHHTQSDIELLPSCPCGASVSSGATTTTALGRSHSLALDSRSSIPLGALVAAAQVKVSLLRVGCDAWKAKRVQLSVGGGGGRENTRGEACEMGRESCALRERRYGETTRGTTVRTASEQQGPRARAGVNVFDDKSDDDIEDESSSDGGSNGGRNSDCRRNRNSSIHIHENGDLGRRSNNHHSNRNNDPSNFDTRMRVRGHGNASVAVRETAGVSENAAKPVGVATAVDQKFDLDVAGWCSSGTRQWLTGVNLVTPYDVLREAIRYGLVPSLTWRGLPGCLFVTAGCSIAAKMCAQCGVDSAMQRFCSLLGAPVDLDTKHRWLLNDFIALYGRAGQKIFLESGGRVVASLLGLSRSRPHGRGRAPRVLVEFHIPGGPVLHDLSDGCVVLREHMSKNPDCTVLDCVSTSAIVARHVKFFSLVRNLQVRLIARLRHHTPPHHPPTHKARHGALDPTPGHSSHSETNGSTASIHPDPKSHHATPLSDPKLNHRPQACRSGHEKDAIDPGVSSDVLHAKDARRITQRVSRDLHVPKWAMQPSDTPYLVDPQSASTSGLLREQKSAVGTDVSRRPSGAVEAAHCDFPLSKSETADVARQDARTTSRERVRTGSSPAAITAPSSPRVTFHRATNGSQSQPQRRVRSSSTGSWPKDQRENLPSDDLNSIVDSPMSEECSPESRSIPRVTISLRTAKPRRNEQLASRATPVGLVIPTGSEGSFSQATRPDVCHIDLASTHYTTPTERPSQQPRGSPPTLHRPQHGPSPGQGTGLSSVSSHRNLPAPQPAGRLRRRSAVGNRSPDATPTSPSKVLVTLGSAGSPPSYLFRDSIQP